jgi:hypothetical protein
VHAGPEWPTCGDRGPVGVAAGEARP